MDIEVNSQYISRIITLVCTMILYYSFLHIHKNEYCTDLINNIVQTSEMGKILSAKTVFKLSTGPEYKKEGKGRSESNSIEVFITDCLTLCTWLKLGFIN